MTDDDHRVFSREECLAAEREVEEAMGRVDAFAADLKDQGIHVGLGPPGESRCVTCGELWPCEAGRGGARG